MILFRIGVKFAILLGLFAQNAGAEVYRLSHIQTDDVEMARPRKPFPNVEKIFRVINLTAGAPFSSFNSEFVVKSGELKRIKSEKINHVMDLMLAQITENLLCEQDVTAGRVSDRLLPGQAWRERTVGPIDHQALNEMSARKYVTEQEAQAYADSTSMGDAERMIYFESLSWLSAAEVLDIFEGKIPWNRISEVDARAGLGSNQIRKLAEAGDPSVKLRVRRATVRAVSTLGIQISHDHKLELFAEDLPFETEYKAQGIALPVEEDPIIYRFELGRASQIPGLENEAGQLSALAGLVMYHHSMTFEDLRTGKKSHVFAVDADVFLHSLKRTHFNLYSGLLGAKEYVKGKKPWDMTLKMSLKEFLDKTLPTLGLNAAAVRNLAVRADSMEVMRWDLDWFRGNQVMTRHHPITIRMSKAMAERTLNKFTSDVEDAELKRNFIQGSLGVFDQINNYNFPESRTVDAYQHSKHSKIASDYYVSGLDMWTATSPNYIPAFMAALAKFFKGVAGEIKITVVVPQTPDGSRHLVHEMRQRGFEYVNPADDLDFWNGPHAVRITIQKLNEAVERFPEIKREMSVDSEFKPGVWRALREINLLPGL